MSTLDQDGFATSAAIIAEAVGDSEISLASSNHSNREEPLNEGIHKTEDEQLLRSRTADELRTPAQAQEMLLELRKREKVFQQSRDGWNSGTAALLEIRDLRLYRAEGYTDFGRYCREKLHIGKSTTNRQINIAEVYRALASTGAKTLPTSERMLRPLLSLKQPQGEASDWVTNVAKVWTKAVQDAEITKKPLTQRSVLIARHQLGLDPKPKDNQPDLDLERRWTRLESPLEHECQFWQGDFRRELRVRIVSLLSCWANGGLSNSGNTPDRENITKDLKQEHAGERASLRELGHDLFPTRGAERPRKEHQGKLSNMAGGHRRKGRLTTVGGHLAKVREELRSITRDLRQRQEKTPENLHNLNSYKHREHSITGFDALTKKLELVLSSFGDLSEKNRRPSALVADIPFTTQILLRGRSHTRLQRIADILTTAGKCLQAPAPQVAKDLEQMAEDLKGLLRQCL